MGQTDTWGCQAGSAAEERLVQGGMSSDNKGFREGVFREGQGEAREEQSQQGGSLCQMWRKSTGP